MILKLRKCSEWISSASRATRRCAELGCSIGSEDVVQALCLSLDSPQECWLDVPLIQLPGPHLSENLFLVGMELFRDFVRSTSLLLRRCDRVILIAQLERPVRPPRIDCRPGRERSILLGRGPRRFLVPRLHPTTQSPTGQSRQNRP